MTIHTPIKKQEIYRIPNTRFPKVENKPVAQVVPETSAVKPAAAAPKIK